MESVSTNKSSIALLNEYKGNIFEFLVAQSLARSFNIESKFLQSITSEFFTILDQQQRFIKKNYPELYRNLPDWANTLAQSFIRHKDCDFEDVVLIGKVATSLTEEFGSADILLKGNRPENLSIKLAKKNSYINSKSSGIKSFISKYFGAQFQSEQDTLTACFEKEFQLFSLNLHQYFELTPEDNFKNWDKNNFPNLPGDLAQDAKIYYQQFMINVNQVIFNLLSEIQQRSFADFSQGLLHLCGVQQMSVLQLIYLYNGSDGSALILENDNFIFDPQKTKLTLKNSSILIESNNVSLQVRLKAMNTFTSPAYKVNCAYKFRQLDQV